MASILLTGGTGYIGSHTAVVMAKTGDEIILYDNLSNSKISVLDRLKKITGKNFTFVEGDVRDTDKLEQTLRLYNISAVIHFAGLKAVGESVREPLDYYDNNVSGTISLLQAMKRANVKTLIFSSSATVYGAPQYLPLDEEHPTSATNPYARSKLQIEEMLSDIVKSANELADKSWRIACLRYFNPAGAHDSGLIGEDPNGIPNNLLPFIAQVASGKLKKLNIFGDDYATYDGTGVRDYIHIMDLAEGHKAALTFLKAKTGWHAVNLGTGRGYSVMEILNAFEVSSQKSIPYQVKPRRTGDIDTCFAKVDKAKEQLCWAANYSIEEICQSMWNFQKNLKS